MTFLDQAARGTGEFSPIGRSAALRIVPTLYAFTLFASALLLFLIQPMFTRMVLPRLGGAPAVWSVAMVFFQTALLAGYAYAHALTRLCRPPRAALVHLALLACAATTLPITIATGFGAPPADAVTLWLFGLFAVSIGLPFVVLSASAPLLQSWFAASGHPQAGNPYVLYAASNLGSFAALIAYPIAMEPLLTLKAQGVLWATGFAALALLVAGAAISVARSGRMAASPSDAPADAAPRALDRVRWMALSAIPSGLVIAVTAHLTTDIAAAPFLWVIPLALYLLTFVAVFRNRPLIAHATVVRFTPFIVAPVAISVIGGDKVFWFATILLNLVAFAFLTLVCHGELYARRPQPQRLTEFYLWTSLGGVIGGAFAGLAAPHLFNGNHEYPILIAAALLCLPGVFSGGARKFIAETWPLLALSAALAFGWYTTGFRLPAGAALPYQIALVLLVAWMLLQRSRPARLFGLAVLAFAITEFWQPGIAPVETARSFFGVHKVVETADGRARLLYHGTTIHGAQRLRDDNGAPIAGHPEPLTYYYFGGPISEGITAARGAQGALGHVAAIGLGTGSLACHRAAGERWTFFEIDPEVVRIARDPRLFQFLQSCAPDAPIVLGDARLTLEASPQKYDLIVLDAFSSDAIPVHLLTREAIAGYLSKLSPRGVILAHISNRHMELAHVVAAVGDSEGLTMLLKEDRDAIDFGADFKASARVAILARDPAHFGDLASWTGWQRVEPDLSIEPWTDDYSNILGAIWRKKVAR